MRQVDVGNAVALARRAAAACNCTAAPVNYIYDSVAFSSIPSVFCVHTFHLRTMSEVRDYWLSVLLDVDTHTKHKEEFLGPIAQSLVKTGWYYCVCTTCVFMSPA